SVPKRAECRLGRIRGEIRARAAAQERFRPLRLTQGEGSRQRPGERDDQCVEAVLYRTPGRSRGLQGEVRGKELVRQVRVKQGQALGLREQASPRANKGEAEASPSFCAARRWARLNSNQRLRQGQPRSHRRESCYRLDLRATRRVRARVMASSLRPRRVRR